MNSSENNDHPEANTPSATGAFGTPGWQAPGSAAATTEAYVSNPFTVVT